MWQDMGPGVIQKRAVTAICNCYTVIQCYLEIQYTLVTVLLHTVATVTYCYIVTDTKV